MVKNVENVESDFQRDSKGQGELSPNAHIKLSQTPTGDRVTTEVALRTRCRSAERSRIEAPVSRHGSIGYPYRDTRNAIRSSDVVEALTERLITS